jgi:putative endonuclease
MDPRNKCGDHKYESAEMESWEREDDNWPGPCKVSLTTFGQRIYAVYMMASGRNGMHYIGVTGDLASRIVQHKSKQVPGFTASYDIAKLVWWQDFEEIQLAIQREKAMKKWPRQWKIKVIEAANPGWEERSSAIFGA